MASSTLSFFSFSSTFESAPTLITPTLPDSIANLCWCFFLIKGLSLPTHFPVGADANYALADTDEFQGPLDEIPTQFHEALAYKAIAIGYQDPRNMKIELAQYFDNEYEKICKRAKKFARSSYLTTGQIVPQEF